MPILMPFLALWVHHLSGEFAALYPILPVQTDKHIVYDVLVPFVLFLPIYHVAQNHLLLLGTAEHTSKLKTTQLTLFDLLIQERP